MKKFLFLIFIFDSVLVTAQFTGSGTAADPYSGGTLTGNQTWLATSSPIYVNGDLTVGTASNAGHLTIEAGVTVRFCSTGADLIISGLGELTADGTPTNQIRFTADADKDGNFGESGETWGHISFQNMTSSNYSIIDNCIIEFGYKYTGTQELESFGGGLHTTTSNLIISNTIFRNNYSGWGGGAFIFDCSPVINNCIFSNNTGVVTGGGCLFFNNCASKVENSVFEKNTSNGGGGGGGVFVGYPGDLRFYNCVFASNIGVNGANIRFYYDTPSRVRFYNSIVWGSDNSIAYYNYTLSTDDFNYCAIQDYSSGYSSCINLNSSNSASDGPNFTDPSNLDYTIRLLSPCMDGGTSSGAPLYDFYGNSRVLNYDIGIFEVQYSRWKASASSTDWSSSSNWDGGVPNISRDVIIPSGAVNYPTSSTTQDFTVGSGKQMIIEQGARVTLEDLTNNGILKLNHAQNTTGFASLILKSYSRGTGGSEEIQLFLEGGGSAEIEDYKWHYISSPVSSLSTNTFTGATIDLAQFVESRPSTSLLDGWVAYDGYVYSTGLSNGPTFTTLSPGKGYNFWDGTNNSFTFGGILNTSDVAMSITYSAPMVNMRGFNLLGNPFSSGLNWDSIANRADYPANTSKGVYFTRDNIQCTYIGGVGTPVGVTGIIPPMQGFFTKTYSAGNTITLAAAARTHSGIHPRYKSGIIIPLVRLKLQKDNLSKDETVVRFDTDAQSGLDYDFDAEKMLLSTTGTHIYSASGGTKYAINGQPFPASVLEIPIIVNITKDTIHTISATQLQGLDGYGVFLRDYSTGINTDLKSTPVVSFSAVPGTISGRFALSFTTTGLEKPANLSDRPFNIYPANGLINIQTLNGSWDGKNGSVRILDITGKTITDINNAEFSTNSLFQVQAPVTKGIYIVELKAGPMRHVVKVVVR